MSTIERISTYDSASSEYHCAFDVFLANTDQKIKAREWLNGLVGGLRSRRLFVDAGAGNGKVTAWFVGDFQRTVALEPNLSLFGELRRACPLAEVLRQTIMEAQPSGLADLVLCSHILYYIDAAEWMANLEKLVSWLAPDGVLVVVVQNHETDCMRMLNHFLGYRFNLPELANRFETLQETVIGSRSQPLRRRWRQQTSTRRSQSQNSCSTCCRCKIRRPGVAWTNMCASSSPTA